jgi:hypothetical protein
MHFDDVHARQAAHQSFQAGAAGYADNAHQAPCASLQARLDRLQCSGWSHSPTADVLTVSATKPTSSTTAGATMDVSNVLDS